MRTLVIAAVIVFCSLAPNVAAAQGNARSSSQKYEQWRVAWKTADGTTHHGEWSTDITETIYYAVVENLTTDRSYWVEQKQPRILGIFPRHSKKIKISKPRKEAEIGLLFLFIHDIDAHAKITTPLHPLHLPQKSVERFCIWYR